MPLIFELDNFDNCLVMPEPLYCTVEFQLEPSNATNPSEVWNIIDVSILKILSTIINLYNLESNQDTKIL